MKYVILSVKTRAKPEPTLHVLLFDEALSHRETYLGARGGLWQEHDSSCEVTVHSAGFVRFRTNGVATCSGRSESLNIGSKPDDSMLVNLALRR